MTRLKAVDPITATGKAKELLGVVNAALGITPNMMRTMANSPAVLEAYLNFSGALAKGKLDAKLRELIAITVAQTNSCEYCLSAHTLLGKHAGLNDIEMAIAGRAGSDNPKVEAALAFAQQLVIRRAELTEAEVAQVRKVGFDDGEISEIVANVALNIFTNYFNHVAQTEVDFPRIAPLHRKIA
ncbi:MAG: carboxymuconolactone decarboxylase family protein [Gammaproteobacteria bacterium]|nr:carboxymuconolactone decarboxylase family protein [Gammaproteobacteria bacterium]